MCTYEIESRNVNSLHEILSIEWHIQILDPRQWKVKLIIICWMWQNLLGDKSFLMIRKIYQYRAQYTSMLIFEEFSGFNDEFCNNLICVCIIYGPLQDDYKLLIYIIHFNNVVARKKIPAIVFWHHEPLGCLPHRRSRHLWTHAYSLDVFHWKVFEDTQKICQKLCSIKGEHSWRLRCGWSIGILYWVHATVYSDHLKSGMAKKILQHMTKS